MLLWRCLTSKPATSTSNPQAEAERRGMVGVVWTFGRHALAAWERYLELEPNTPLQYAGHLRHPANLYNPRLGRHREAEILNFAEYQRFLRWACWDDNINVSVEQLRAESESSIADFNRRTGELSARSLLAAAG